jgi:hypothetical protein
MSYGPTFGRDYRLLSPDHTACAGAIMEQIMGCAQGQMSHRLPVQICGNQRPLLEKALKSRRFGSYTLQAAIAAVHGGIGRCDRLAADCCALRPIGTNSAFAGGTAESCRGYCHARWPRGRVWGISTLCWNMANWPIITWRIRPVPTCAAGSAGRLRLALRMRRRSRSRNRSGNSCKSGFGS